MVIEEQLHEGVFVDINFERPGPEFGDLFTICGFENPNLPPLGRYAFGDYEHLGFTQVDDYFGVPSRDSDGDDIAIWLFPIIDSEPVDHHPGPYDALRLEFNVLRNPAGNASRYLECTSALAPLGTDPGPDIDRARSLIETIAEHWTTAGITPGSKEALSIDW